MLRRLLQRTGQHQEFLLLYAFRGPDIRQLRTPLGDGSRLIQDHCIYQMGRLQALAGFNQDALLCPSAGSNHDCRRGSQAKRARTRDHEHGNSGRQREAETLSCQQPDRNGNQRDRDHDRYEDTAYFVRQFGDRSFGSSRFFHQTDNLGKRRIFAHPVCLHMKISGPVHSRSGHPVSGFFLHRNTLAGNGRFVNRSCSFYENTVHRYRLPRFYNDCLAQLYFFGRDLHLPAVP